MENSFDNHSYEWYTGFKEMHTPVRLTKQQRMVLAAFKRRAHDGLLPPTYRELCAEFGWRSTGTARDHLRALVKKGVFDREAGKARGTQIRSRQDNVVSLPLIGDVVAGQPVVSEERTEDKISIPAFLAPSDNCFLLRVRGDSMEGAGIHEGDIVVVKQTSQPCEGNIVVVTVEGETTIKKLVRMRGFWFLVPENSKYAAIKVSGEHAIIHGVVTGLIRSIANN